MEAIYAFKAGLFAFGACRIWQRETFFGISKQSIKILIYIVTSPVAAPALLLEAIFRVDVHPRLTKKSVAKEIRRSLQHVLKTLPAISFEGDMDVEARRCVEYAWEQMTALVSKPAPYPLCAASFILAQNVKRLEAQKQTHADIPKMALANLITRTRQKCRKLNKSDLVLLKKATAD